MPSLIIIPGLTNATKRPGFFGQVVNPAGRSSASSAQLILLLIGNKISAGSMTPDTQPVQIFSADDADTLAGAGSELACMAYGIGGTGSAGGVVGGALAVPNVAIYIAAMAEAGGGTASTATITIAGSWTAGGSLIYRISGIPVVTNTAVGDSVTNVAENIVLAVNGNARLPVTATNLAGVVTLLTKNVGVRTKWHSIYQDTRQMAAGMTSTLTGGTAMTGGGKHFTGGAGSDSPANLQAIILAQQFDRIVQACGDNTLDTTHAASWKIQLNAQAAPTSGILQQMILASNDTLANAAAIAKTTLNDTRFQMLWGLNVETHPYVIASTFGATRTAAETLDPDAYYDAAVAPNTMPGVAPQTQGADRANAITQETALAEGVTPLLTFPDGTVRICRSIQTHCLNGANPDFRVLDTSGTTVPDYVLKAIELIWTTDFLPNNPRVQDNPAAETKTPTAGIAYPDLWSATVFSLLQDLAQGIGLPTGLPILDQNETLAHPPTSQYVGGPTPHIMSAADIVPAANQHQIGQSVRNVTSG